MQTLKDMLAAIGGGEMTPGGGIGGGLPQGGFPQRPQMAEPRKLKDWQKALGVLGSGLTALGGGTPTFARNLMEERRQQEAARQRFDLAEYEGQLGRANKQWEWQNKPDEPTSTQRDFQWYNNLSEQEKAVFDQFKPVITSTWQGPQAVPRSSLGPPTKPVGNLTMLPDQAPTMQNTPPPQMSSNGNPVFLTPDQYRVTVDALGKERTDDWMRRHNVRIGGQ